MKERKTFIRRIKQGDRLRYAEVWNERRGKKVIQHHVRYLGTDPDDPAQFEYLAGRIPDGTLAAADIRAMLDRSGKTAGRKDAHPARLPEKYRGGPGGCPIVRPEEAVHPAGSRRSIPGVPGYAVS